MRNFVQTFMRFFFKHLYTTFAWVYDFVAWTTSMGQWRTWQQAALIEFDTGNLLEIGHGPGHLLLDFSHAGYKIFGVERSRQMSQLACKKIRSADIPVRIARSEAQALPFMTSSFSGVVATFPSEYILDRETLQSIHRVLKSQGKLVVVGLQSITSRALYDRFASWLYQITGQSDHPEQAYNAWLDQLANMGFSARIEIVEQPRAKILRLVAKRI